jgi:hypothetical protein
MVFVLKGIEASMPIERSGKVVTKGVYTSGGFEGMLST